MAVMTKVKVGVGVMFKSRLWSGTELSWAGLEPGPGLEPVKNLGYGQSRNQNPVKLTKLNKVSQATNHGQMTNWPK